MCRIENEEEREDGKDGISFKAGVGVTCLVQFNIFTDSLQFTNVSDVLKNEQLSMERGCEVSWLNPFVIDVGHSDTVVFSEIKISKQENV